MERSRSRFNTRFSRARQVVALGACLAGAMLISPALAQLANIPAAQSIDPSHQNNAYPAGPPYHRPPAAETFKFRDLRAELKNKMTGTFTVASTGDVHQFQPVVKRMSPQLRDVLRKADITVGNLETGARLHPEETAKDMAEMGFKFLAPGEDGTPDGYQAMRKILSDVGIKISGVGPNLTEARRAAFQEVPQGLVGFLAACPGTGLCGDPASNGGFRGPSNGVNPVGLMVWNTVTQEQFNQLKAIQDSIFARRTEPGILVPSDMPPEQSPGRLVLFGVRYMVAEKPGNVHYEVNPLDEQAQILGVRNAKEVSDFVIFHMHNHENRFSFQQYSNDNYPADFMQPLIHKLIDNGLDMYVGSGNHTMQGIEIYKGRPIFYNQGNIGIDVNRSESAPPPNTLNITGPERAERSFTEWWRADNSSAFIANTTYKDGRLTEIRVYPVDNGLGDRPWSKEQIPTTPTPEKAREILQRIQKYSEPFGTKISIENNIGVIRVPPEATVDVGGDLNIPGRQPERR